MFSWRSMHIWASHFLAARPLLCFLSYFTELQSFSAFFSSNRLEHFLLSNCRSIHPPAPPQTKKWTCKTFSSLHRDSSFFRFGSHSILWRLYSVMLPQMIIPCSIIFLKMLRKIKMTSNHFYELDMKKLRSISNFHSLNFFIKAKNCLFSKHFLIVTVKLLV